MSTNLKIQNIEEFSVHLDTPGDVFIAGRPISGYVMVNLRKPIDVKNVQIELSGKAYCCWMEGESENYIGKEKIIKKMTCLCGSLSGSHAFPFPKGEQKYEFSFELPERLPSSFEGTFGHIRYFLKATIHRSWKIDHKVKLPIKINDRIDPNLPAYKEGKGGEKHKKIGLLCYKSAPIDISASIDRSCYCPDENILVDSQVTNNTSKDTNVMYAKLIQTITYLASGKQKSTSKVVARLTGPKILKGTTGSWENEPFEVPHVSPSITNCRVICVQYKIAVKVSVRCSSDPAIKLDVAIGTVPFVSTTTVASLGNELLNEPPRYHDVVDNDDARAPLVSSQCNGEEDPPRYSAVFGDSINITLNDISC